MIAGPSRSPEAGKDEFELMAIYVDPCFERTGTGTDLVRMCDKIAERQGMKKVILWVFEKNAVVRSFYEKCSFAPTGKWQILERFGEMEVEYCKALI